MTKIKLTSFIICIIGCMFSITTVTHPAEMDFLNDSVSVSVGSQTYLSDNNLSAQIQEDISQVAFKMVLDNLLYVPPEPQSEEGILENRKPFDITKTLILGDSLTVGMNNTMKLSDQGATVDAVISRGVSKTAKAASKYSDFDFVIVTIGTNDCGGSTEVFEKNYRNLIETITANNPDAIIFVNSIPPCDDAKAKAKGSGLRNVNIESKNELIKTICDDYSETIFVDNNTFLKNNGFGTRDGIHFDSWTYECWWNWMYENFLNI